MLKYSNFAIVASFFSLWLVSFISNTTQLILGFILILTFGILHGANDLLLIKNIDSNEKQMSISTILTYYIIVVALGAIMFWIIPWLALLLFIIVSGYHFGEQQWQNIERTAVFKFFQFVYGLLILMILFVFNAEEVQDVILDITAISIPVDYFTLFLLIIIFLLSMLCAYFYNKTPTFKNKLFLEIFYLLVFTIIFKVSSLIWGFAIYFIVWHSIPSIINQVIYLNGEFNKYNLVKYIKSAFLYWMISLIGIAVLYLLFKDVKMFNALFFSFLAAITFPHVLVIFVLLKNRKSSGRINII